ncbi:MAG: hypothetical protein KA314_30010 [Chloroflexi bacterium]|nr:hypothetical protein [Chloroflexota bacterium]
MNPYTLKRFVALDFLVTYTKQGEKSSPYQLTLLRRQEVLALQSRWQWGLPQADVCQPLGVSEQVIVALVETRMLWLQPDLVCPC